MKCKVGDLVVVIRAQCKSNLGRIVLIVGADDGTDFVKFKNEGLLQSEWVILSHFRSLGACK